MIRHRLATVALCALAATTLAACTGEEEPSGPTGTAATPQPSASQATLRVSPSTFQVAYRLDGSVAAGSAVGIDAPPGTEFAPSVDEGAQVEAGQRIGSLRLAGTGDEPEGTVAESQQRLAAARVGPVIAPTAGVARLGRGTTRIDSAGLDVVVPLKPLQELRYRALEFDGAATVETVLGQRRSPCVAIWLEDLPVASDDAEQSATSAVHCRLAADVETASGLPAVLTLTSAQQSDVVAVPLIYIGLDKTGKDYIARVRDAEKVTDRPVVVGSTDGVRRVITDGLKAGDVLTPIGSP